MNLINQVSKRFNSLYDQQKTPWIRKDVPSQVINFSETVLQKSHNQHPRLLDLGCGNGWLSIFLTSKGFKVEGIDSSPVAITQAQKLAMERNETVSFTLGNALTFPFDENSFDVVFDRGLLHHLPESAWPQYVFGVNRVLKPKGWMYLGVFSDTSNKRGFSPTETGKMEYRYTDDRTGFESYDHFFNEAIIRELFGDVFLVDKVEFDDQPSGDGSLLIHFILRAR
jgi:SAM-dependent methyltransferase